MLLSTTLSGRGSPQAGNIQAIVEQGLQMPLPAWQGTTLAQLTSTRAALVADERIDAVIHNMTASQSWDLDADLLDGTDSALAGLMGSVVGLSELMSNGIGMASSTTEVTRNADGTVTVTSTYNHDAGVAQILSRLEESSAAPAEATGNWLATQLGQSGEAATQNMAAFSASLPLQIPDFVHAGAASSALGGALAINLTAFF